MRTETNQYERRIRECILSLGGDPSLVDKRNLPFYPEATDLVVAEISNSGTKHRLEPTTASAWAMMKIFARREGCSLILISAFRSFERQYEILLNRVDSGLLTGDLFRCLAPPGCSQHHTGRAVDIGAYGAHPATESFADTPEFAWLERNAKYFGFEMSYPENNIYGFTYEPWHWYLKDPHT